ncbi:hypothetical protein [Cellulomonas gilvus]|uniref:Abi-like protein n=1 Tax=Cellulomonas gilvus (strain ATCC 13127 / NRRL B-14078) TaxID=593907 RepID=F8A7C2_CELGA|nr:hypothetical protein [Cellulomonas gilvus]AEI11180.1 hypothetical protein Celgi_0661 [Cellulomonas gilvus ATCC 13127]
MSESATSPHPSRDAVWELLSEPRLAPYLRAADDDRSTAVALYEWNAKTAAAAFETVGHLEVLLRNALDRALTHHFDEHRRGIAWFLLETPGGQEVAAQVDAVRARLRARGQESRHQIVAGLSFGFWSGLLGPRYEDVWRESLHKAFPNGNGQRKQVSAAVERVRKFRNRLAHHDSMINVDVPFEIRQVIEVASYISTDAAAWLTDVSRAMDVYRERPVTVQDTVVVPAREAWRMYELHHAYVCQAGRTFRPITRMAFYAEQSIKADVPLIVHRRDNVEWTDDEAARLLASTDRFDRKIAPLISAFRSAGWTEGRYQVFLLTRPGDARHRALTSPLPHAGVGRGSAFVQRQRYTSLHALEVASSTSDL